MPGRWEFRGYGYRDRDRVVYYRGDRDDWRYHRDWDDRHFDRDRDHGRDWDHDHFRR
jgi:hypothetical protein